MTTSVSRLKKRASFLAVAANKKTFRTPTMLVQLKERLANEDPEVALRVGFTATRRHVGNAVTRNRARRRLRAVVAQIAPTLMPSCPIDLVLIATATTATAPYPALVRDFLSAMKRFSLLGEAS
ncbi:MAG: ribonuclease P protein component [Alphaproteobacteria bacterium]